MRLTRPGPSLSDSDIRGFEQDISARLPKDYKCFLMGHNGGCPARPVGYEFEDEVNEIGAFDSLVANPDRGLRRAFADFQHFRSGFLPIASDFGERDLCIEMQEPNRIYLAEYEYDDRDSQVDVTMTPLAESFSEFLDRLVEVPVLCDEVAELGERGTVQQLDAYLCQGRSIDAMSKNRLSLLCEAVKNDNTEMIDACIARGASLSRALHSAAYNNRPKLIDMLVNSGADVNERTSW